MDSGEILTKARQYCSLEKDAFFKKQVEDLIAENNEVELRDRFYTDLAFGTGGLRGIIGGGFNRMNSFTVQRATQGLANYLNTAADVSSPSAVIAYDNRHFSAQFALDAALVLGGNGIKTYVFSDLRPTPELSFAIRHLKATTGIVITASHNPPEYNGYKAYWSDGCQIIPPHDAAIVAEAAAVTGIKALEKQEALDRGLLIMIDQEVDAPYCAMVKALSIRPELVRERGKTLSVVYTPLHGTGGVLIPRVLSDMGITVTCVEEQMKHDGNFSTVASPNPEEPSALKMAIACAENIGADLVCATDPDADRLGVAVRGDQGFTLISGNQLGALLADYIFSGKAETGTLPVKPAFIKTIVTTELQRKIAETYHATCFDVLTGFKYIGEKIREFESDGKGYTYLFGGEESFGYLVGTAVRDKDAISAAVMTIEMTLYHKSNGRTLLQQLDNLYAAFGYYEEALINKMFKGEQGVTIMQGLMEKFRTTPPRSLGGQDVVAVKDFLAGTLLDTVTGKTEKTITLPRSNVLQFILKDTSVVSVRPSGTEPKIKFYASCCERPQVPLAKAKNAVRAKIDTIKNEINTLIDG